MHVLVPTSRVTREVHFRATSDGAFWVVWASGPPHIVDHFKDLYLREDAGVGEVVHLKY